MLVVVLSNVVNVFNFELVVFGGFLVSFYVLDLIGFEVDVVVGVVFVVWEGICICLVVLGEDCLMIGVVELVFFLFLVDLVGEF